MDDCHWLHLAGCTTPCTEPGYRAGLQSRIDSAGRHEYLVDHVFSSLSYVPATFLMEMCAEAAAYFAIHECDQRNFHLLALENFFVERALVMAPGSSVTARILLKLITPEARGLRFRLEIRSARFNGRGDRIGDRRNVVCDAVMGDAPTTLMVPVPAAERNSIHYAFPRDEFYRTYFPSLGPRFRTQTGRFQVSADGAVLVGTYDLENRELQLIGNTSSIGRGFVLSPLGLDTCLQYTVFLSRIHMTSGRLPVACGSLLNVAAPPASGVCHVIVRTKSIDAKTMVADFDTFDASNSLLVSARDVTVQHAPVNQLNSTYHDRSAFEGPLRRHAVTHGAPFYVG